MQTRATAIVAGLALFAALGGCATVLGGDGGVLCRGDGLLVAADFPAAGRHDCAIAADGRVIVSVDHEPVVVEGVNPSPWYALRIRSDTAQTVTFVLDYTDYRHRYAPHVSTDGQTWTQLPPERVVLNEKQSRASVRVDLPAGFSYLAGQPVSPSADNIAWTQRALPGFKRVAYGLSLEGRPLVGFVGGGASGEEAVVILTRQHPPETSGQDAYRGFIERLMQRDDAQARAFRASRRLIVAPMPNPDGVDNGNWRTNQGGVDLNRDWASPTQPETKAITAFIKDQTDGRRVIAMMDFHSTDRDVIYAPPLDAPSPSVGWLNTLKSVYDAQLPAPPPWTYSHNPEGGTSKTWALETLKAPGLTVELWDRTPPADARALGAATADALIEHFTR